MFAPNIYPAKAVIPIAMVPQKVIRIIALKMLEPPVLAAIVPNRIRKKIADPYNVYSILFKGRNSVTSSGSTPPTMNEAPEARAAWIGFA